MYFFKNDYNDICIPEVLDALKDALDEKNPGYSFDNHSKEAEDLIKKELENENVDVHFVPGGTSANILGVTAGLKRQESVIAATSGHIQGHEAGAIEANGIKIELIYTEDGKLTRELLEEKMAYFGPEFMTVPRTVYISNTTEVGTVYKKSEIEEIYEFCKENDLYLYIDGARMSAALVSEEFSAKISDLPNMCDIFTLGGTKNGLLFGEALVIVNDELKKGFLNLKKQNGSMMAKGFVSGIMFKTMFNMEDGYLKGARHAHKMAKMLAEGLEEKDQKLFMPFYSNQVFVISDEEQIKCLEDVAEFEVFTETPDKKPVVRFVTTYRTTEEEIKGLISEF